MENKKDLIAPTSLGALAALIGGNKYVSNSAKTRDRAKSININAVKTRNKALNALNYDKATSRKLHGAIDLLLESPTKSQIKEVRQYMNRAGLESPKQLITSGARASSIDAMRNRAFKIDDIVKTHGNRIDNNFKSSIVRANKMGRKQRVAGALLGALLGIGGGVGVNNLMNRED